MVCSGGEAELVMRTQIAARRGMSLFIVLVLLGFAAGGCSSSSSSKSELRQFETLFNKKVIPALTRGCPTPTGQNSFDCGHLIHEVNLGMLWLSYHNWSTSQEAQDARALANALADDLSDQLAGNSATGAYNRVTVAGNFLDHDLGGKP